MLPPDFEERKRAAQEKSARMRALNRLRANGIDPTSFPHQFLTAAETDSLWNAPPAEARWEQVPGWESVCGEIATWARGLPQVAIFFSEAGYCLVPGVIVAASIDVYRDAAMNGRDCYVITPDGRTGRLYAEDEHSNSIRRWDAPTNSVVVES